MTLGIERSGMPSGAVWSYWSHLGSSGTIWSGRAWRTLGLFGSSICFAKSGGKLFCEIVEDRCWFLDEFWWVLILIGCAQTAAVGGPMVVGLLFFLSS